MDDERVVSVLGLPLSLMDVGLPLRRFVWLDILAFVIDVLESFMEVGGDGTVLIRRCFQRERSRKSCRRAGVFVDSVMILEKSTYPQGIFHRFRVFIKEIEVVLDERMLVLPSLLLVERHLLVE